MIVLVALGVLVGLAALGGLWVVVNLVHDGVARLDGVLR
jgi:hypothetical protein